ncbi:MAG: UDP-N-acetylglucosamine 1-carboxyvinyltransferase [Candidatus Paceibacterota bacterium]
MNYMAEKFIINGERKLEGAIEVRGSKNAAFPIIMATLLTQEDCIIDNIPLIEDIQRIFDILKSMDVEVQWLAERKVRINAKNLDSSKIREDIVRKLRGSILLFGALLAREGKAKLPQPGGCVIGARPISTHLDAFAQLGVKISPQHNKFKMEVGPRLGGEVLLNEFSVTGTCNVMIFSALQEEATIIKCADQDYQVQELAAVLKKMGAGIRLLPMHMIEIKGAKKLKGFTVKLIPDPIEAGTFILMAAATKSKVLVKNVPYQYLEYPLKRIRDFGIVWERPAKDEILVLPAHNIKIEKVQALPYPGMPTDLLPLFGVLSTQLQGLTLLHDPLYEGRLKYLEELNKMGANIIFADPHRAIVSGPTPLYGVEINSPDLRGGASLIVGALIASGSTTIGNIYQVDRGYEKIDERLRAIGADIQRINT